jgi:hypothetical protein
LQFLSTHILKAALPREEAMSGELEARVNRLEKSNRRWKLSALIAGSLLACGVLMAQGIRIGGGGINAPAMNVDKVNCKSIVLTDAAGNERINIAVDGNDNVVFALKEKGGTALLEMRADSEGGASVKFASTKGKTLAILGADAKDQPGMTLKDAEGKKLFSAP